jgi:hypothetical protein
MEVKEIMMGYASAWKKPFVRLKQKALACGKVKLKQNLRKPSFWYCKFDPEGCNLLY